MLGRQLHLPGFSKAPKIPKRHPEQHNHTSSSLDTRGDALGLALANGSLMFLGSAQPTLSNPCSVNCQHLGSAVHPRFSHSLRDVAQVLWKEFRYLS